MIAALIAILFAATFVAALGVIMSSWLRHAPVVAGLRQQLATCEDQRELRFTVTTIDVRNSGATVYYPDFGGANRSQRRRSALTSGPRAAA